MRIVEVNRYSDFLTYEETWRNILQRCDHSIFSTWEWLSTWWKHFGNDKRLALLLAEENGKIVGIAPLMYSVHKMFGLRMGKIEFIGTPDSDYADFIIAEKSEECINSFIEYVNNLTEKWKRIELSDMPENPKSLHTLREISRNVKQVHKCPYISLSKSCETYLLSLPRKHRKELNRNMRVIEKEGFKMDFADYSDSESLLDGMNEFFNLHQKRWTSRGFAGAFEDQKFRNFNLEIAKLFSEKGWLGLFLLKLSDKPVAALFGFRYQSRYYAFLSGFDPQYSRYGVGGLLFLHTINYCIKEGLNEFDFMRGAEEYKDRWNTMTRWNSQAIITRRGFLEDVEYRLYDKYWQQGSRLKYIVKNAPRTLARMLDK